MVGLITMASLLLSRQRAAPNARLCVLNPHISQNDSAMRLMLPVAVAAPRDVGKGLTTVAGTSSFGYSGTIAHAILASQGAAVASVLTGGYRRHAFGWESLSRRAGTAAAATLSATACHTPFLGAPVAPVAPVAAVAPPDGGQLLWEQQFAPHELAFLQDHCVGRVSLLPGTCYVEMARAVVRLVHGDNAFALLAVQFKAILFLDDELDGSPTVRVGLRRADGLLTISSLRRRAAHAEDASWEAHSTMDLQLQPEALEPMLQLASVQARCSEHVTAEQFYRCCGNEYKGEFRSMRGAWGCAGGQEVLSSVGYANAETQSVHLRSCAWLDACLHAPYWWSDHRHRPFYIASVTSYAIRSMDVCRNESMWSLMNGLGGSEDLQPDILRYHSDDLCCRVQIDGSRLGFFEIGWLEARRAQLHLYQVDWRPVPAGVAQDRLDRRSAPPFTMATQRGIGQLEQLTVLAEALRLVQAAADEPLVTWVVTSATQAAGASGRRRRLCGHAGLLGLGRTVRQESPTVDLWSIDLESTAQLLAGRSFARSEPEIAEVDSGWAVPRLVGASTKLAPTVHASGARDGAHAVTGATGGLGMLTARWLGESGMARRLLLVSRSGAPSTTSADWERLGLLPDVNVRLQRGSVDERRDVGRIVLQLLAAPSIGVWHAAGVLADAVIAQQNARLLHRVFAPKVSGVSLLHCAFYGVHLCTLALFSSVAALFFSAAQANYAAANCCLDALAVRRTDLAQNALSINWGPWANVGMAASSALNARMKGQGLGMVSLAHGLSTLQLAMSSSTSAVIAMTPVNWRSFLPTGSRVPSLLSTLVPPPPSQVSSLASASTLSDLAQRVIGRPLGLDEALATAGLDSLGAIELRNLVHSSFGQAAAAPLQASDHTTLRQLWQHVERVGVQGPSDAQPPTQPRPMVDVKGGTQVPVSSLQHQLLVHQQIQPESTAYHEPFTVVLSAPLPEPAARAALQALVRRHAVLRTSYELDIATATFAQVVLPEDGFVMPLTCSDAAAHQKALETWLRTPFDLLAAPPVRAMLLQVQPLWLVVNVHHVAADLQSMIVLRRELDATCKALTLHRPLPQLPALTLEYADYAQWEATQTHEESLAWWSRHLEGIEELIDLPLDRPRPPVQQTPSSYVEVHLHRQLTSLARALGVLMLRLQPRAKAMTLASPFARSSRSPVLCSSPTARRRMWVRL